MKKLLVVLLVAGEFCMFCSFDVASGLRVPDRLIADCSVVSELGTGCLTALVME
jgi:hypothetical protein